MSDQDNQPPQRGAIAWMAKNSVAANLLMVGILLCGVFLGMLRVKQEVFPEFSLDLVSVRVPYPGASPEEVEQGIVLAVEEEVRGLDGVKTVTGSAGEGFGSVVVELQLDARPDKVLADIKNAVDGITSFPLDAEEPRVSLIDSRREVITMVVSGDQDLSTLQEIAERARTKLLAEKFAPTQGLGWYAVNWFGGSIDTWGSSVTYAEVRGVPPMEVAIEVPRETLERYGLTLDDIALRVRAASLELPAGGVDTTSGEVLVKLDDRRRSGDDFRDIVVRGTPDGGVLTLDDIATIRDTYAENDQANYLDGRRAVQVVAYRVGGETPQSVAGSVKDLASQLQAELPSNIDVTLLKDDSELLKQRIDLLVKNAATGLLLVLLVLYLFLNVRLAFWVALGIPISFMGAFALMPTFDITINMISLFGFIITLGLVVDDAIVIGENIYEKLEQGIKPMQAAITGAREMAMPVTFAILTTLAAFSPMFFVPGVSGKLFRILPGIVLAVLIFSLIESFFVLPAHLGHETTIGRFVKNNLGFLDWPSNQAGKGLAWFTRNIYEPSLRTAISLRYIVLAAAAALFFAVIGMAASGFVPFTPFPMLEGNTVTVSARLPFGAPVESTEAVRDIIETGAFQAMDEIGEEGILVGVYTKVGEGATPGGPVALPTPIGSHLLTIELELVGSEEREVTADQVAKAWERNVPEIPGLESLVFNANVGPSGTSDIDLQVSAVDLDMLIKATDEITEKLRSYSDLTGVTNSYAAGKPQITYTLEPAASTYGITGNDVARQMRSAFFGAEALREQRGRNEVRVMVRLPRDQRTSEYDLEQLRIRTAQGGFVPLGQLASLEREQAPTDINREDGRRIFTVTAKLAEGVVGVAPITTDLQDNFFPQLREKYPGLDIGYGGAQADLSESLNVLFLYFAVALVVMYALLAIPFKSYFQPILIMGAIPMGVVGAVLGHLFLGYELSMVSMFGIVALSGVVVNDSLVLIDAANTRAREGLPHVDAIMWAGARRLRPILLTSLTTFFGLMPLIFETSVQARFIVPMAISLGFGVLFATFVTLILIPAGYMVLEDGLWLARKLSEVVLGSKEAAEIAAAEAEAEGDTEVGPVPAPAK